MTEVGEKHSGLWEDGEGKSVSVLLVKSQTGGGSERVRWGNAKYIQLQIQNKQKLIY